MTAELPRGVTPRRPPPMEPMGRARYIVMMTLILVGLGLLAGRIVDLHVINRNFLQVQGDARTLRTDPIPAHRGMITDRHGGAVGDIHAGCHALGQSPGPAG